MANTYAFLGDVLNFDLTHSYVGTTTYHETLPAHGYSFYFAEICYVKTLPDGSTSTFREC